MSSQSNNPDAIRAKEERAYRQAFAGLANIYRQETQEMPEYRIKNLVKKTLAEGMYSHQEGQTRTYPKDISVYLDTGEDPEDNFELGGAL